MLQNLSSSKAEIKSWANETGRKEEDDISDILVEIEELDWKEESLLLSADDRKKRKCNYCSPTKSTWRPYHGNKKSEKNRLKMVTEIQSISMCFQTTDDISTLWKNSPLGITESNEIRLLGKVQKTIFRTYTLNNMNTDCSWIICLLIAYLKGTENILRIISLKMKFCTVFVNVMVIKPPVRMVSTSTSFKLSGM